MRPDEDPVAPRTDQVEQPQRLDHVVEHAARDDQVGLRALLEEGDEAAELEPGPLEPEDFLHAQAFEEGAGIRLDARDRSRAVTLDHRGVPPFERPEFDDVQARDRSEDLVDPVDADVLEQGGMAGKRLDAEFVRHPRGPLALEQVDHVLIGGASVHELGRDRHDGPGADVRRERIKRPRGSRSGSNAPVRADLPTACRVATKHHCAKWPPVRAEE